MHIICLDSRDIWNSIYCTLYSTYYASANLPSSCITKSRVYELGLLLHGVRTNLIYIHTLDFSHYFFFTPNSVKEGNTFELHYQIVEILFYISLRSSKSNMQWPLTSWEVSINWKVFFYPVSQKFGFFENICLAMGSSIKDIRFWRKWGMVKCQKTSLNYRTWIFSWVLDRPWFPKTLNSEIRV